MKESRRVKKRGLKQRREDFGGNVSIRLKTSERQESLDMMITNTDIGV